MMDYNKYNITIRHILEQVSIDSKVDMLDLVLTYLDEVQKDIINLNTCIEIITSLKNNYKQIETKDWR